MKWALYNLTTTTKSGGMETIVWWLARALADQGHEVVLVAGKGDREPPEHGRGIPIERFAFRDRSAFPDLGSRARKLMERLSFARNAAGFLKRRGFDRVMIFKPYDLAPALWAARGGAARVGYFSGGTEFYPGFGFLAGRLDYLGAISRFNAAQIKKASGLTAHVNYPGVDAARFRPAEPDREMARACGVGPGDEVLVTAVRLVPLKGVQYAVKALAMLKDKRPGLRLLVAGEGPYKAEVEKLARELGVGGRVSLVGYVGQDRLAGFYALGQVAVFPSTGEEALGLSPAEALACGLPVVASDLGGIPEVVGGRAGVLIPQGDAKALAGAVDKLMADPGLRGQMAERGRKRVSRLFDWQGFATRLEEGLAGGR